jgi:hypothetical protein
VFYFFIDICTEFKRFFHLISHNVYNIMHFIEKSNRQFITRLKSGCLLGGIL